MCTMNTIYIVTKKFENLWYNELKSHMCDTLFTVIVTATPKPEEPFSWTPFPPTTNRPVAVWRPGKLLFWFCCLIFSLISTSLSLDAVKDVEKN